MNIKLLTAIAVAGVLGSASAWSDDGMLRGHWWFDRSTEVHDFTPGSFEVDASQLYDGFHTFNAYVETADGVVSSPQGFLFFKPFQMTSLKEYTVEVYVDGKLQSTQEVEGGDAAIKLNLDCSNLGSGIFTVGAKVITPQGNVSSAREALFFKDPKEEEYKDLQGYYTLDGIRAGDISGVTLGNPIHLDIDASRLLTGIHYVEVFLTSPSGIGTSAASAWFVKIPNGGEGVMAYDYWLNDKADDLVSANLENRENPLSLMSLLEVSEEPFCSERYAFAIEDGAPVTYARNDFWMRFFEDDNTMSYANGSYIDTRVRREVDEISLIEDNAVTVIPSIEDNTIKWYKFEGEIGDSIAVKLDRGGMLEIYKPNGETLMANSGFEATQYACKTLVDNGTYYLAVHDIKGYDRNDTELDFTHIAKFDVISSNVNASAPREFVIMDLVGNGFSSLKSIELVNGERHIVPSLYKAHDNFNLSARFDFDESMPLGDYTVHAVFNDEEKGTEEIVDKAGMFKLEAAAAEVLVTTELNTPNIYGIPLEFNVSVTNHSNVPLWGVPVNYAVESGDAGDYVAFKDFAPLKLDCSLDTAAVTYTENLLGSGHGGYYLPLVLPYLGPNETVTLSMGFGTSRAKTVKMYAWSAEPWSEGFRTILSDDFKFEDEMAHNEDTNILTALDLCNMHALATYGEQTAPASVANSPRRVQRLITAADRAQSAADVAEGIGRTIGGTVNALRVNNIHDIADSYGIDLNDPTYSSVADYENQLKRGMHTPREIIGDALGISELQRCEESTMPLAKPHEVQNLRSWDPNEMTGYVSPAGSKYMAADVKTVNYTIEFENDPSFANASAMTIKVDNALDGKVLDLKSFRPLTMEISGKKIDLPQRHNFFATLDMRPEINAVAQLRFKFDENTGLAQWTITSLDPMTMEETRFIEDGVLPVNDDEGRGIGHLTYQIDLVEGLADGTRVSNQATIVFDDNDPINTPTWTNTTDYSLPTADLADITVSDDKLNYDFNVASNDKGSGIWTYDLYMRLPNEEGWTLVRPAIKGSSFSYASTEALEGAQFAVVSTDQAGNRQDDSFLNAIAGDADTNGRIEINDVLLLNNCYTGKNVNVNKYVGDINRDSSIDVQDVISVVQIYLDGSYAKKSPRKRIRK